MPFLPQEPVEHLLALQKLANGEEASAHFQLDFSMPCTEGAFHVIF